MKTLFFSNHINSVFANAGTNYDEVKNLMTDLALHRDMYDADGNKISKQEANDKVHELTMAMFELKEGYSPRDFDRAIDRHIKEWFEVIEETVDEYIAWGMRENEVFNQLVNLRSRALGQDNLFWVDANDIILSVQEVGTSHSDYSLQRLNMGSSYTVPVKRYGAAVGMELNAFMVGQEPWDKLVSTLGKSFAYLQQTQIYNLAMNAADKLPVTTGFVGTGAFSASTKDAVDQIIQNVSMANDGAEIIALGTHNALKQFSKLGDVDWISNKAKDDIYNMGRLAMYEGTDLVAVGNRFTDRTLTSTLYDDSKILFFAKGVDNKMIDMYTYGETEINEITQKYEQNGRYDHLGKYQMEMSWGMAVRVRRMFGQWTLPTPAPAPTPTPTPTPTTTA